MCVYIYNLKKKKFYVLIVMSINRNLKYNEAKMRKSLRFGLVAKKLLHNTSNTILYY